MLPHFTKITPTATDNHEPLYQNLFEVTFTFPKILGLTEDDSRIMMLNAKNINLDVTPNLEPVSQKFKYSTRLYLTTPKSTSIDNLEINFNINVDDNFSMRTWNYMKKWYDLAWNSQTGELHYKKDMIGEVVAHIHDREGVVIRRTEFKNCQLKSIDSMNFDWGEDGIISGKASFASDYWVDQYFDIQTDQG